MKITVKHKYDGTIYYVTEAMIRNSKGVFIPVDKEEEVINKSALDGVDVELSEETEEEKEDKLEAMRQTLRDRDISFHPNCGEKALLKKIKDSE